MGKPIDNRPDWFQEQQDYNDLDQREVRKKNSSVLHIQPNPTETSDDGGGTLIIHLFALRLRGIFVSVFASILMATRPLSRSLLWEIN